MGKKTSFDICLKLLAKVVAARGGDSGKIVEEYPWPGEDISAPDDSKAAVSLAPLLTGEAAPIQGNASVANQSGVVPMPVGLKVSKD